MPIPITAKTFNAPDSGITNSFDPQPIGNFIGTFSKSLYDGQNQAIAQDKATDDLANSAWNRAQQAALNLQTIQASKDKHENDMGLLDIEKKKMKIAMDEAEMKGSMSAVQRKAIEAQISGQLKSQEDLLKAKTVVVEDAEHQHRQDLQNSVSTLQAISARTNPNQSPTLGAQVQAFGGQSAAMAPQAPAPEQSMSPSIPQGGAVQASPEPIQRYEADMGKFMNTGDINFQETDAYKLDQKQKEKQVAGQDDVVNEIADGVVSGNTPPDLKGLYRYGAGVRAELAKRGFNLSKAQKDWNATTTYLKGINSTQQIRMRQALNSVSMSIPELRNLNDEFKRSGWTPANFAEIKLATSGTNPAKRDIATRYLNQIALMKDELAQGFMGGGVPTDSAFKLADDVLNPLFGNQQMSKSLDQLEFNLNIRDNAITSVTPVTEYGQQLTPPTAPTSRQANPVNENDPLGIR